MMAATEELTKAPAAGSTAGDRLVVALVAFVATWWFFHPYLPPTKKFYLWSDIAGYHYPLQRYAFDSLKQGRIPEWDPSIYCGISFVGNTQAALLYPPTWLMYAIEWHRPRLPFKALEVFTLAHVWLGFMLCYMWLRGRGGKLPSALAAAVFAYTGYMVYQLLHPGVVCAMAWMPLGLWGIDEATARRDWRPLWKVAVASAMSFLAGYPACWLVYAIIAVAYALGGRGRWRAAAQVCGALAASLLLFTAQLLPAMEARSMMMLEPKYGSGAYGVFTLLASFFVPNWFDFNIGHPTDWNPGCIYLYLGLPAAFAILWALGRRRLRPYVQPLVGLAVALWFANPPVFFIKLIEKTPLDYTLQPYNFYAAVAAMAALITAIGLNDFFESAAAARRGLPPWLAPAATALLVGWSARQILVRNHGGIFPIRGGALAAWVIALAVFALAIWVLRETAGRRAVVLSGALLFAVLVDYYVYGSARWFNAQPGDVDDQHAPYGIAGTDDDAYRAMVKNRQYRVIPGPTSGPQPTDFRLWGLATPEGFDPFLPLEYRKTVERWVPFVTNRLFHTDVHNEQMLQALGVRYVSLAGSSPDDAVLARDPNFRLIGRKDVYSHIYEYLHAKPPFHWEDERAGGTAVPTAWLPEVRDFRVRSARGGRFVFVEQFYPGWKASVDGEPVKIERWGGAFQAIQVPAGEHQVRFEFSSPGFAIGAGITIGIGVLLAVFWPFRRTDLQTCPSPKRESVAVLSLPVLPPMPASLTKPAQARMPGPLVAAAAAALVWQLFVPPAVGVGNNADFGKVTGIFHLGAPDADNFRFADTKYQFGCPYYWAGYYSTELLLVPPAIALNALFSQAGSFDLRFMGLVHASLFLLAVGLFARLAGDAARGVRAVMLALAAVMFCDVMYAAYFNSFYMDTAAYIFLLLTAALFLRVVRRHRRADAVFLVVCAVLMTAAKGQHTVLGLWVAALFFAARRALWPKSPGRFIFASAGLAVFSLVWFWFSTPPDYDQQSSYNMVFYQVLPHAKDPGRTLADLGLDDSWRPYIGKYTFMSDSGMNDPAFARRFHERVTHATLARFFLTHPRDAYRAVRVSLDEAGRQRPQFGNYDRSVGLPDWTESRSFAFWSGLKRSLFFHHGQRFLVFFVLLAGAVAALLVAKRGTLPPGALAGGFTLIGMAVTELAICSLADCLDVERHYLVFYALFDMLLLTAVYLVVAQAFVPVLGFTHPASREIRNPTQA